MNFTIFSDGYFMKKALDQAQTAFEMGEVPVGAVVVWNNQIIAKAHNQTEQLHDITAHAEILAITSAADFLASKYLTECTLYVTLEPCVMCAGALHWAQLGRLVFGASDDKKGFMRFGKKILHPATKVEMGLMEEESALLLSTFFEDRRKLSTKLKN